MKSKKKILLDSSSAILLEKSAMLDHLLDAYEVVLCESVYTELTENSYPSSRLFRRLVENSQLQISHLKKEVMVSSEQKDLLALLGEGEKETIKHFMAGMGDFIMLDDGKAAKFCFNYRLPFINALLLPTVLAYSGRLSLGQCESKTNKIKKIGRYSDKILTMAEALSRKDLRRFIP